MKPAAKTDPNSKCAPRHAAAPTVACTAALFAAQEAAGAIGKTHIVRAIARQFRREARLLAPIEPGPYASLLQEAR